MDDWLAWLLSPIDHARIHDVGFYLSWHARLTFVVWTFLVPIAIVVARYFKVLPSQEWPRQLDSQFWWLTHQVLQYTGTLLTAIAVCLVLFASRDAVTQGPHAIMGWAIVSMLSVQVLGGWLRGSKGGPTDPAQDGSLQGDHYDMTRRRVVFEYVHKVCGYLAVLLAIATVVTGLWQSNAPRWMWLLLILWWLFLLCWIVLLQKRRLAIDTYQAIWGPDPALPGNQRKPIGIGIRQVTDKSNQSKL